MQGELNNSENEGEFPNRSTNNSGSRGYSRNNNDNASPPPDYNLNGAFAQMDEADYTTLRAILRDMVFRGLSTSLVDTRPESPTEGMSLSEIAIRQNRLELANLLKEYNLFNWYPYVTRIQSREMLEYLLEDFHDRGIPRDINIVSFFHSLVVKSIEFNSLPSLQEILNAWRGTGIPIEELRERSVGLYTFAASVPNSESILEFLETVNLGDPGEIIENDGGEVFTPLSEALQAGNTTVVQYLLTKPQMIINIPVTNLGGISVLTAATQDSFSREINTMLLEFRTPNPTVKTILDSILANDDIPKLKDMMRYIEKVPRASLEFVHSNEAAILLLEKLGPRDPSIVLFFITVALDISNSELLGVALRYIDTLRTADIPQEILQKMPPDLLLLFSNQIPTNEDVAFYLLKTAIETDNDQLLDESLKNSAVLRYIETEPSALLLAIKRMKDTNIVKLLAIKAQANGLFAQTVVRNTINTPPDEMIETTFLASAAEANKPGAVSFLLHEYTCYLYKKLEKYGGKTVMELAREGTHYSPEINDMLRPYDVTEFFSPEEPPEDLTQFEIAILKNDVEAIVPFLREPGFSVVGRASSFVNNKELFLLFLDTVPDYYTMLNALLWAIKQGDPSIFQELRAKVQSISRRPEQYIQFLKTHPEILVNAVERNMIPIVELLLKEDHLDVNTADAEGTSLLAIACMTANLPMLQLLLSIPGVRLNTKIPRLDNKSILQVAKEGGFAPEINTVLTETYSDTSSVLGWYQTTSVPKFIYSVFTNEPLSAVNPVPAPEDISLCPVCFFPTQREGGCMYMHHPCDRTEWYNKTLFDMYQNGGEIEWCTICNRMCTGMHRHYKRSILGGPIASLVDFQATTADQFFLSGCQPVGGGGVFEKLVRFNELLKEAVRIQYTASSKEEALTHLSKVFWDAPLAFTADKPTEAEKNAAIKTEGERLLAQGNFDVDLSEFPEDDVVKRKQETILLAKKPEKDATLVPEVVEAEFTNLTNFEEYTKGIALHHRSGEEAKHHTGDQLVSYKSVANAVRSSKDITAPTFGTCPFYPDCKALLWPEDIAAIPDLIRADCTGAVDCVSPEEFQIYRDLFNKKFGEPVKGKVNAAGNAGGAGPAAVGGRRRKNRITIKKSKSTRKMRGGFNPNVIPQPSCPLPPRSTTRVKVARKRLGKNRKTRKLRKARK